MSTESLTVRKLAEDHVREAFPREVATHQMQVHLDEGVYRHLSFRRPDSGMYGFDLHTSPGRLVITGDLGTYTFARTHDMFGFFCSEPGYINASYWGEKLTSIDKNSGYRQFSEDIFINSVRADIQDQIDELTEEVAGVNADLDEQISELVAAGDDVSDLQAQRVEVTQEVLDEIWGAVENDILDYGLSDDAAHQAVRTFSFSITVGQVTQRFYLGSSWEMDFHDYSHQFIYCLHAIVWGVNTYNEAVAQKLAEAK